ncbi:MAG TPA: TonB-dependent receptor, partial [Xanthomonadales bacterium]|nr:TonB-dependent receptor [Xanthomonadales bacterium]
IAAINNGTSLGGLSPQGLEAILEGADTPGGSIQIRNNSRKYYSQGIQLIADKSLGAGSVIHQLQFGLRYHEDQEDRLQRNDNYQQMSGQLVLNEVGLEGNAGNRVQNAKAWAAYLYDRIEFDRWTLTPGLRYENIKLSRDRYFTDSADPSSRDPDNFRDSRENTVDVWLPGIGAIFEFNESSNFVGGVHRGFATPGNEPGVDPEDSTNYELGFRHSKGLLNLEAMFFFNDYKNLVGVCTNSSGSNCDPGDSFNGEGVHIPGFELTLQTTFDGPGGWQIPMQLTYTWMNAKFQSSFDSEFFGDVTKGDPVPYVPRNQLWASIGIINGPWSLYLSGNHVDSVCTKPSCGVHEETESSTIFNVAAHYDLSPQWQLYAVVENLADKLYLVAREPYGARSNKPRSFMAGVIFTF